GCDDLARGLWPFDGVAALVVADEAGVGAVLAHDADLGVFGEGVFQAIGQPIGVGIAYDHDRGGGVGFFSRRPGRLRIIDRRLALRLAPGPVLPGPAEPAAAAERIVRLRYRLGWALWTAAPIPELRLRRHEPGERQPDRHCRGRRQSPRFDGCAHRLQKPCFPPLPTAACRYQMPGLTSKRTPAAAAAFPGNLQQGPNNRAKIVGLKMAPEARLKPSPQG